jgi:ribonucleoside-diphosphate reductase alpha chain
MWENRNTFNGLSVLPHDGGNYVQAPFEDCDEEKYKNLFSALKNIDLTNIIEYNDETKLQGELACSGGACEVRNL